MQQLPVWVRTTFGLAVVMAAVGVFTMNFAKIPERKVFEPRFERQPILPPAKMELTPAVKAATFPFPQRGREAGVELASAVSYPEGEMTTATPVILDIDGNPLDVEYCRMLRESGIYPQTVEEVIARHEVPVESDMVPLSEASITLIPYHECEEKGTNGQLNGRVHLFWAFLVGSLDSIHVTRVKVPEGGLATRVEGLPPSEEVKSGIVQGRYMQVRGIPPQKSYSK